MLHDVIAGPPLGSRARLANTALKVKPGKHFVRVASSRQPDKLAKNVISSDCKFSGEHPQPGLQFQTSPLQYYKSTLRTKSKLEEILVLLIKNNINV